MSMRQLDKHATEQKRARRKTDARTLKRIIQAFGPYKLQLFLVLIIIIGSTLLSLVPPFVILVIFDDAIPQRNIRLLFICFLLFILTPVFLGFVSVGQTYLSNIVGQRVIRDFRNRLYAHLQRMSFSFFTSTQAGDLQSRFSNDIGGIKSIVTDTATRTITNVSIVLSTIIAMLYINPLLTLLTLGILPLFIWFTYKVGNMGRLIQKNTQQSLAALMIIMQETLSISGVLLIKTFGRQHYAQEQFERENQKLADLEVHMQMTMGWFFMLIGIIFSIAPAVIYLVGGTQIINNGPKAGITIGGIIALTTLLAKLIPSIGQVLNVQVQIQGALAIFDRIFEYLDLPIDIQEAPEAIELTAQDTQGTITFNAVTFTYKTAKPDTIDNLADNGHKNEVEQNNDEKCQSAAAQESLAHPTLNSISFEVKPGQLAALVGPSGAGKTTITYLLPRLYDTDSGTIEIDGKNIKNIKATSLSELIGVVTQETYLFHASIKENLLYTCPGVTDKEIMLATKAAAIHDRIMEFENGYDTIVGERGYRLSGGEKQRLAIARVILKNPRILILDEATSSLDTHSERLIQQALVPLMRNRTTLAIAHRLSTIIAADIILVVDKGEIVERGTHQELLESGGLYTRLYNEQFSQQLHEEVEVTVEDPHLTR